MYSDSSSSQAKVLEGDLNERRSARVKQVILTFILTAFITLTIGVIYLGSIKNPPKDPAAEKYQQQQEYCKELMRVDDFPYSVCMELNTVISEIDEEIEADIQKAVEDYERTK